MKESIVTVFGSGTVTAGSAAYQQAYELGQMIAQAGWTLCNGGYGGTMKAAAKGAFEAGGQTIGVTCLALNRSRPNEYVRREVATSDLLQRLNTLVKRGRAYVVLPGGTGTLLELAYVLELTNKGFVRRRGPIVLLGDHWQPVVECINAAEPDSVRPHIADDVLSVRRILAAHLQSVADG